MRKLKAELILVFIAVIWGATFVIIKLSLPDIPPFSFLAIRFSIASILFFLIFFKKIHLPKSGELKGALILGLLLFLGFSSQIYGMVYTTASKSALITGVNLLIIPFAQYIIIKKKVGIENWIGVIAVLFGLYLLTKPEESGINKGDLITLICAISWAFYIIYLDVFTKKYDLYILVFIQFLIVTIFAAILALIFERSLEINFTISSIFGLLYTAIPATLLATYLGNKYQKETTPVRAAILITFEQPSAVFFAIVFLKEYLEFLQITGGLLMILGILFSETYEYIRKGTKVNNDK